MKRRVHKIEHLTSHEYVEAVLNTSLTNGERIVATYVSGNFLYVITEDLGLGPPKKK